MSSSGRLAGSSSVALLLIWMAFRISTALWLSFVARGLHSWQGDYFCYSAIQSAGVVLILPGFSILTAALDLVSKNFISGGC